MITFLKAENKILTKNLDKLRILPIGDCHIGDSGFAEKELKEKLYSTKYEPTLLLWMGDILNNAVRSSVSNCYKEVIPAGDPQINYANNLFSDYIDLGLCGVIGNHEARTVKESNVDIAEKLYEKLKVPYLGIHGIVQIQFGRNSHGDSNNYFLYMHHGSGGGVARAGKTKKMVDQEFMINGADCYIRAHTHLIDGFSTSINQFDARTKTVNKQSIYHVSSGNWLDTSDYAEVNEFVPLPIGSPEIYLNGKEKRINLFI